MERQCAIDGQAKQMWNLQSGIMEVFHVSYLEVKGFKDKDFLLVSWGNFPNSTGSFFFSFSFFTKMCWYKGLSCNQGCLYIYI